MTHVPVNLTNVDADGPVFETMPEGMYQSRLDKAEVRPSKNTEGNNVLHIEAIVTNTGTEFDGRRIFDDLSLSNNALWRVKQLTDAAQIFPGPEGFDSSALLGQFVNIALTLEPAMERNSVTGRYDIPKMKDGVAQFRNRVKGYSRIGV